MARLALLALAALAAACPSGGGGDDYPIGGGGTGGGTSGPRTDAGGGGGDGGTGGGVIRGRVCLLGDLRRLPGGPPGDCLGAGAGGLSVALGAATPVLTADDGAFAIPAQAGTNLSWRISRLDVIAPSFVPVSAATLLPAIGDAAYRALLGGNGVVLPPGRGAIVARILRNNLPVPNVTARVPGGESLQTFYDGADPLVWDRIATGPLGVAWLPDNSAGLRTLEIGQGQAVLAQVPVAIVDQAITFVAIALP